MESTAMLSRSLRIRKDTLDVLTAEAEAAGMGITVYIRHILEQHVATMQLLASLGEPTFNDPFSLEFSDAE